MKFCWIPILALSLVLASCGDPGGTDTVVDTSIHVSANIAAPATWATGKVYRVTTDVSVTSNLVIEKGVEVIFDAGASLTIAGGASFTAVGDADNRIVFTSSAAHPAAGQWEGIYFGSGAVANTMAYCDVEYAGIGDSPAIAFYDLNQNSYAGTAANASIQNCVVSNNLGMGIYAAYAGNATVILNDRFFANGDIPVAINSLVQFDATNQFSASGQAIVLRKNCIEMVGDITAPCTLSVTAVPYYFPVSLNVASALTIEPGVVVKMGDNATIAVLEAGSLNAMGESGNPIVFTSFTDSATLGQSNGLATTGAAGDWGQILFHSGAIDPLNALDFCTVKYAGHDDGNTVSDLYAIEFYNVALYSPGSFPARASLSNLTVSYNYYGGILADQAATRTSITGCSFADNGANGTSIWDLYVNGAAGVTTGTNTGTHIQL